MTELTPGLRGSHQALVEDADTAISQGSGTVPVLSTPRVVAWLEAAAVNATAAELSPGSTTVGIHIDIRHVAAIGVGMTVTTEARLSGVEGRILDFDVTARSGDTLIAEGTHQRALVDVSRFLRSVEHQ